MDETRCSSTSEVRCEDGARHHLLNSPPRDPVPKEARISKGAAGRRSRSFVVCFVGCGDKGTRFRSQWVRIKWARAPQRPPNWLIPVRFLRITPTAFVSTAFLTLAPLLCFRTYARVGLAECGVGVVRCGRCNLRELAVC